VIHLQNQVENDIPAGTIRQAVERTLAASGMPAGDVTVVLTGDEQIQSLNREYLGNDHPTDVLAFPAGDDDPETGRAYLGDVIISLPHAAEGARGRGHDILAEVQLLVIHGVLHLLGHDHADEMDKARMDKAQAAVLAELGLQIDPWG